MGQQPFDVRVLTDDDWPLLREMRLAALREDSAFLVGDHTRESSYPDKHWREQIRTSRCLVALLDATCVGLVRSIWHEEDDPENERYLSSLWVAPQVRRRRVATRLIDRARRMEARRGVVLLKVWVLEGNHQARKFYLGMGFRETDVRELAPGLDTYEERLELKIAPG